MDANLTFNTIVFRKTFDSEGNSVRQSTTRGINTPDVLTIRSQNYVDGRTKVPGKRYNVRIDREELSSTGQKFRTAASVTVEVPELAESSDVDNIVTTLKAAVASSTFLGEVLNDEK